MLRPRHLLRLANIFRVLRRHGLHEIVTHLKPRGPIRFLFPERRPKPADKPLGERLRLALEDLGPIFVKFGQALSTRPDLLPAGIAGELAKLQDDVPPFPGSVARKLLDKAFGKSIDEVFASFDETPRASASIAQVHDAILKEGPEVVVKVLRPDIRGLIHRDLDVLHMLAALAERYWEESRRLHPREIVNEYEKTVTDELDLLREAANASLLKRNFPDETPLYIPTVYWDYCKPNVMVMERVHGEPVSDVAALREKGVDLKILADRGVEIFFTQVFKHNFFHADMHPGNIFVNVTDPKDPCYVAVDFGIVGTLTASDQHYLAGNLLAFFKRDYHKVALLHVESGWVPAGTRVDEFESAIRTVSEPIFNRPIKEISFGQFLVRLFQTARRFNMEVQPQLVLLQKTLLNIEGLGRQIYPDLDLWQTAKPFLEDWMAEQTSGREMLSRLRGNLPELSESLQTVPQLLFKALQQAADGKLTVQVDPPGLDKLRREARRDSRRRYGAVAGGSVMIAAAVLIGLSAKPMWLGWSLGAAASIVLWMSRPRG